MTMRTFGIWYLSLQSAGATIWWVFLFAWPASRVPFRAHDAPDVTLLAFFVSDLVLFILAGAITAYGLVQNRNWAWPLLCVHCGAAMYAALYCWTLTIMTGGDGFLGAIGMTPSLFVPAYLAFKHRLRALPC